MKRFAILLICSLIVGVGCHAQVPPATSHVVDLVWTAPTANSTWTGCTTSAPCTYAIYRAPTSAGSCPASTNSGYVEVTNPGSRPSGTTFVDTTAGGLTVCYIAETVQGSSNSGPSNTTAAITVPGTPTAPALGNPTAAANQGLPLPMVRPLPEVASASAPAEIHLTARVVGR